MTTATIKALTLLLALALLLASLPAAIAEGATIDCQASATVWKKTSKGVRQLSR